MVVPYREKKANLIAAEYTVSTGSVLDLLGYESQTVQAYIKLKSDEAELSHTYEQLLFTVGRDHSKSLKRRMLAYHRTLMELQEKREDLGRELSSIDVCHTTQEIAGELGVPIVILEYKLEALKIRGYDIDALELAPYDKVFTDAL